MQTLIRNLGSQDYLSVWQQMLQFTQTRTHETADELWVVEHPAVYTFGLNGKPEHLLQKTDIPVVNSDRGGQITYHATGQLVVYTLLDINRLQLNIRQLVTLLEQTMITALAQYGITANAKKNAPGVYVDDKKIGSIGLRVKKNGCYHGLSLNNNMDLSPFNNINTCGFEGLEVTSLQNLNININTHELAIPVLHALLTAIEK
ncbi:MAG: lipoyl(octanoyl) transferase LipB [Methylococcaceae bacterium]|nr:lipoyl(octanoyl) transferase LipB [Methylococcaceae bacterium]